MHGPQQELRRRQLTDDHLKDDAEQDREDEPAVLERTCTKEGMLQRAQIQGMEQLRHGQHHEGHRLRMSQITLQPPAEGDQRHRADEHAVEHRIAHAAVGEQALAARSGRLAHDVALLGIHAQRQSGKRVGHQIDPQDLHRAQRRADGRQADDSQKQRHDLPQIAAEQIDHRFLDVHVQMASFAHRIHDRRKPIVGQDHV